MLRRLMDRYVAADLTTAAGRAMIEERYWSLRRQVPIVYLLGFVNLSAMELAAVGHIRVGINLPTFIATCAVIRLFQWFGKGRDVSLELMVERMKQTVWFAAAVCLAVCARSLYLFQVGDEASHMAVMLFSGLTAIGVAYGLTALPAAGRIPLILIIVPISAAALLSNNPHFAGAAFGLVVVAALTLRLLTAHSQHFADLVRSRSVIAREQERVEQAHQEAVVAAMTDFLTGLPNRRAFVAALEERTSDRAASGSFAIAILDLDRFKAVNDTFGHRAGDQLLREVASRLVRAAGSHGLVARLGGDEFGIFFPSISRAKEAQALGAEILRQVNGATIISGRQLAISACCGIAISRRREERTPSRIMADADLALYQSKENRALGGIALFDLQMEAPRRRRAHIETALQLPGFQDNLHVAFQPIFELNSGEIIAHEALARWTDPDLGSVPPSEFVPLAEQLHLIGDINKHLMAIAFSQAREWPQEVKLSFNLSAIQLCSSGSAKAVLNALKAADLTPQRLQIEVTETALLADFERARENLTEFKRAGVTIVLDDFGAGYASIGYLRELNFDQIKLDGGLVTAAQHSLDGKRLLRAVIGLCDILGVSTVAEHVESKELLMLVMELGCTAAQGFWLKSPISAEGMKDWARHDGVPTIREFRRRAA